MTKEGALLKGFVVSSCDLGRQLQVHDSTMRNAFYVLPSHLLRGCLSGGGVKKETFPIIPVGWYHSQGCAEQIRAEEV